MIFSRGNSNPAAPADLPDLHPLSRLRKALELVAFFSLLLAVIAAAAMYASVDSSFQLLFASLFFLLSAIRIAENILGRGFVFADRTIVAPVLGLLLLAVFQITPLSAFGFVSASPSALTYISLSPYETVNFILLLGSLLLLGDTLLHFTRTPGRLKAIAVTVIIIGMGSALFGICRQIFPNDIGLQFEQLNAAPAPYAQFINRNHFALLIEMTLGLLLGLALKAQLAKVLKIACWVMIVLCWGVIISANSRGGIISAVGMILLAVVLHFLIPERGNKLREREPRKSPSRILRPILVTGVLSTVLLGILTISIAFIGGDTVVSRFENTNKEFNPTDDGGASRAEIWQATMRVIRTYPITGAGFGAFPQAVTELDTYSNGIQRVQQAHNEYLEIAASGGAIAVILTIFFLFAFFRRAYRSFQERGEFERAICFGAVMGVSGVLLHSVVDFGLHVYLNAVVFVLLIVLASAAVNNMERT